MDRLDRDVARGGIEEGAQGGTHGGTGPSHSSIWIHMNDPAGERSLRSFAENFAGDPPSGVLRTDRDSVSPWVSCIWCCLVNKPNAGKGTCLQFGFEESLESPSDVKVREPLCTVAHSSKERLRELAGRMPIEDHCCTVIKSVDISAMRSNFY